MNRSLVASLLFLSMIVCSQDDSKHVIGAWPCGFGSAFLAVLNHFSLCESFHKTPVVYWDQRSLYYDPNGFNGSYNVWEYYFEPVSASSYVVGDLIDNSYGADTLGTNGFHYKRIDPTRHQAFQLIHKYVKIKSIIQEKIDRFYQTYMRGKRVIGIHLRGTDKVYEEFLVSPDRMIKYALEYDQENTVYLIASDEQRLLDRMLELLKDKEVIYYNCYRSRNNIPLHTYMPDRPSRAQLGEDMLVEMSLLAKCNLFIHTASNVSAVVLYFNPNLEHILMR